MATPPMQPPNQDGVRDDLLRQLQRRIPVPVGWLHKGPVEAPSGGGHWSLVISWDPKEEQLLLHDPKGELCIGKELQV